MATSSPRPSSSSSRPQKQSRGTFLGLKLPQSSTTRPGASENDPSVSDPRSSSRRFPLPLPYPATVELDRILGDSRSSSVTKSRGGQMPYVGQGGRLWRDRDEELEFVGLLRDGGGGSSNTPSDVDEPVAAISGKAKPFANTRRGNDRRDIPSEKRDKIGNRKTLPAGFAPPFQAAGSTPSPLHQVRDRTSSFSTPPFVLSDQMAMPPVLFAQEHGPKGGLSRTRRLSPAPDLSLSNPNFIPPPPHSQGATRAKVDFIESSFTPARFTSEFSPVMNDQGSYSS